MMIAPEIEPKLTEAQVRAALLSHISAQCCYGTGAARNMVVGPTYTQCGNYENLLSQLFDRLKRWNICLRTITNFKRSRKSERLRGRMRRFATNSTPSLAILWATAFPLCLGRSLKSPRKHLRTKLDLFRYVIANLAYDLPSSNGRRIVNLNHVISNFLLLH